MNICYFLIKLFEKKCYIVTFHTALVICCNINNILSGQSIGTVFQGPGFESRWGCMFFTLVVL